MKIYQIHKYGGEWEDYYDYIVGSYIRKERAEEMMGAFVEQSKSDREQARRCGRCPAWNQLGDNTEQIAMECGIYCDKFHRDNNEDGTFECSNWMSINYESHFRIEEVEVEE